MINPFTVLIVLVMITMLMNLANVALAVMIVKKNQTALQEVKSKHLFNPWNEHSITIWFVVFSIFVSLLSFMVNSESILTLHNVPLERVYYGIKFRIIDILSTLTLLQYHVLLLMKK